MPDEVAANVFHCRGTDVNFYLVRDGRDLTLIDCGYPGDQQAVEQAIRDLGSSPRDVRALLVTHAHVDHIGTANHLYQQYETPFWTGATEARHARREFLEQATPADVVRNIWRPGVLSWTLRIVRKGGTKKITVPQAEAITGPLDLPGRPVPLATPGHTTGHTAYLLPDAGAVLTGDALVTGHPLLKGTGPQLLPAMFNHGDMREGLSALRKLDADLILPGHGEPLRQPIAGAVDEALSRS